MDLRDLIDEDWNSHEEKRFLKDDTKQKTEAFDPESFKYDGFEGREQYFETYAPALAEEERLDQELSNFEPPRLSAMNDSPYQALVIRYGILKTFVQQLDYSSPWSRAAAAMSATPTNPTVPAAAKTGV